MAIGSAPGTLVGDDVALKCIQDLEAKIESIPRFDKRTFLIFKEDDLADEAKLTEKPCAGIFYTGLLPVNDSDGKGMSNLLTVTVVLIAYSRHQLKTVNSENKIKTLQWLGQIRRAIRLTKSPTGHAWVFKGELPVNEMAGHDCFIQRWATPAILTNPDVLPNQMYAARTRT